MHSPPHLRRPQGGERAVAGRPAGHVARPQGDEGRPGDYDDDDHNTYWECNLPITLSVRRLVGCFVDWAVGRLVFGRYVTISPKGREVALNAPVRALAVVIMMMIILITIILFYMLYAVYNHHFDDGED